MTQSSQKVQTSVEWFMEKLYQQGFLKEVEYVPTILINEAKERYNIELGNAYQQGWKDARKEGLVSAKITLEPLYQQAINAEGIYEYVSIVNEFVLLYNKL